MEWLLVHEEDEAMMRPRDVWIFVFLLLPFAVMLLWLFWRLMGQRV